MASTCPNSTPSTVTKTGAFDDETLKGMKNLLDAIPISIICPLSHYIKPHTIYLLLILMGLNNAALQ